MYTDRDRRKSIATRQRKARLRREQIAKLGYNPYNPTVKLADNLIVTESVKKRLTKKAKAGIVGLLIPIWVLTGVFITYLPESEWRLLGLLPAAILTILNHILCSPTQCY